jgi:hypothetical protein
VAWADNTRDASYVLCDNLFRHVWSSGDRTRSHYSAHLYVAEAHWASHVGTGFCSC